MKQKRNSISKTEKFVALFFFSSFSEAFRLSAPSPPVTAETVPAVFTTDTEKDRKHSENKHSFFSNVPFKPVLGGENNFSPQNQDFSNVGRSNFDNNFNKNPNQFSGSFQVPINSRILKQGRSNFNMFEHLHDPEPEVRSSLVAGSKTRQVFQQNDRNFGTQNFILLHSSINPNRQFVEAQTSEIQAQPFFVNPAANFFVPIFLNSGPFQ
jgi:hypothetical protein